MIRLRRHVRKILLPIGLLLAASAALGFGREYATVVTREAADGFARLQRQFGFVVADVEFTGRRLTPLTAIAQAVGPVEGRLLGSLDLAAIRTRLEAISWISRAEVLRIWPDRLAVHLTERKPFALWQREGVLSLVDAQGTVLTREGLARWRHLPFLVGEGAPQAASSLLRLLETTPELAERVAAMLRIGDRRWDLEMDNGIRLRLPASSSRNGHDYGLADAWRRFATLERRHRLLARAVTSIDLRLADRIALRLSPQGRALGMADEPETSI